jgi:DNA polymerase I
LPVPPHSQPDSLAFGAGEPAEGLGAALFGFDPLPGVVAVEVTGSVAVLIRRGEGDPEERLREERPFRPWLLAHTSADDALREGLRARAWTRLRGDGLAWLAEFDGWEAFTRARALLREERVPHHAYGQPVKQFLVRSGITLFQGLEFPAIRRLQFDLETSTLGPDERGARILLIAAGDNRGRVWTLCSDDEAAVLAEFVRVVAETDPDVIEGHNLFNFDVPYLAARAEVLGVPLTLGRNGAPLTLGRERGAPVGGVVRPYRGAHVWGRHLADTLLGVQRFDVGRGALESHGLKEVAQHYGLADAERVMVDRRRLADEFRRDPDRVRRYAEQDVQETRKLAELVLPTDFYQTQMVPDTYQNVATGGTGEKINSLLIREYLRRGCAIPVPGPVEGAPGGHTEIRETGLIRRVVKADVESLYPSIMLHYRIRPERDTEDVFLPMLAELTRRRLDAKGRMGRAAGTERSYWDGLQSSFKILINSFYGYLGVPSFHFNDTAAAARITTTGQELVKQVADALESSGARVIEIDTDGVYFVPPEAVQTPEAEADYIERIGAGLPHGIRLTHDGRYAAMLSLKVKNYVLVGYDGRKTLKGASLRSRAEELFGREFLTRAVDCLLAGDLDALAADYERLARAIAEGSLPLAQFQRRERVTLKTFESEAKKRSREVARDAEVGDSLLVYQRADGSLGLAEDYAGDEDRWHYTERLYRFAQRLEGALTPEEFARVFPRPVRKRFQAEQAGQLSLFD